MNVETLQNAYTQSNIFFKSDEAEKATCFRAEIGGQRGFTPGERAKNNQVKDYKQFYHIGRELPSEDLARLGLMANIWPTKQPEFKQAMVTLYNELDQYIKPLQRAVMAVINKNASIKLPEDLLNEAVADGDTLLRALYYPAISYLDEEKPLYWAAEHTDIDLLAILPYATAKGLQVQVDGKWHNVVVPEDAFVVNVGDMLENLTNGLFVSSRHRVLAQEPGQDRFSMVLFVHPTSETALDPLEACIEQTGGVQKYGDGSRIEFLFERLLELNIAPHLRGFFSKKLYAM